MAAPSPGPLPPNFSPTLAWTIQQDKRFEQALAMFDDDTPDRWDKIAAMVPGKDASQAKKHYELLLEDVGCIEAGRIALPNYNSYSSREGCSDKVGIGGDISSPKKSPSFYTGQRASIGGICMSGGKTSAKSPDNERKKGVPWTEDEHRFHLFTSVAVMIYTLFVKKELFLLGLDKFGKGDWRSISRNFVITRTPTQVASHAQKYFIRLNSINKDKRRSSIHDITSVSNGESSQPGQVGPITGQTSTGAASCSSPIAQTPSHTSPSSRPPLYVPPAVGQSIGSPIGSDVGNPVLSSPPPFPIRPPPLLGRPIVSPSPLPISGSPLPRPGHSAFSVPQSAMHQLSGQG